MKVIFLKDIKGVGRVNEIKDVADGYAMNFLLPKKLAKLAVASAVKEVESKKSSEAKVIDDLKSTLDTVQAETVKNPLIVRVKTGEHGEVFGGVHEADIEKALFSRGFMNIKLEKLERPIKQIGRHKVAIKMGKGIAGEIDIEVKTA